MLNLSYLNSKVLTQTQVDLGAVSPRAPCHVFVEDLSSAIILPPNTLLSSFLLIFFIFWKRLSSLCPTLHLLSMESSGFQARGWDPKWVHHIHRDSCAGVLTLVVQYF